MWRIVMVILAILTINMAGLPANGQAQAVPAPAEAPAGMHRFTVSIGGLRASSRENWVRLGTYELRDDGTVTESHWHWTQRRRVTRSYTGVTAADCEARRCNVQTGNGFQSTAAPQRLAGTYTVNGDDLAITWTGGLVEEWKVTEPLPGKLAKLTFVRSSFGATHGFGYGSEAAWSKRAPLRTIAAIDWNSYKHNYFLWKQTASGEPPFIDTGAGSPFWYRVWQPCTGGRCIAGTSTRAQYYIAQPNTASNDRRDTLWHWFTANADGRGEYCYTGNSHVKPMLQIVDSDGGFHGWVAVEASINQTSPSQGALADDIGVFEITDV